MSYAVTFAEFLADPLRVDVFLVDLEPVYIASGAVQALRYASDSYVTAPTDSPANYGYVARASVALNVEQTIVQPGTLAVQPLVSGGEIRIAQLCGEADALRTDYDWNGAAATVRHVGYSPAHDGWVSRANGQVLYVGEVSALLPGLEEMVLSLRSPAARLDEQIQTAALLGSPWMLYYDGSTTVAATTGPEPKLTGLVDDITPEFLIYLEDAAPAADALIVGLSGTTWPWALQLTTGGALRFLSSSATYYTTTFTFTAKRWYHVSVACDATSTIVRIHDVAAGTTTTETDAADNTGRPAASADAAFSIGGRPSPATDRINGFITQVRVWNYKRTESEIVEARFRRLTEGEEANASLVGLWRGDDGEGDGANALMADSSAIVTTQTTITADETAGVYKFTRASGSFITNGWTSGMRGQSSGFGTSGNNGLFTVSNVAALELTVTGLTLVDEVGAVAALLTSAPLSIAYSGSPTWVASLEGHPDTSGTLKPLAYGRVESAPGILVNAADSIFMFAHNGSEISAVYVGGVLLALDTAYTDLTAFLLATTDPAKYDTLICDMGTFVRIGSQPNFPVTIDGKGDASGSGHVETAGAIARRIVTTRGTDPYDDPAELDTTSFSDLDTANSSPCGVYAFGDESVADLTAFVLGSVGAAGFLARATGKFTVNRFGGVTGSPVATFDQRHIVSLEAQPVDPPVYAVVIRYRKQYSTLSLNELVGTVVLSDDAIVARLTSEYLTVRVEDASVLARFPRAGTLILDTGLMTEDGANTEGLRTLALYSGEPTAYRAQVSAARAVDVIEGDVIELTVSEYDLGGEELARLGLVADDASSRFVVLGYAPVMDEDGAPMVELVAWKGGS